ncbi:DUF5701 family protein [Hydrogenophaga sp.]|uniref:DUF5701 family protein n=1 Tax=Hydrogenophaga sp. TaxID=1904254 RepID=UPI003F702D65
MKSFDEQVDQLVKLGYPEMLDCTAEVFRQRLSRLRAHLPEGAPGLKVQEGTIGYVLIINSAAAPVEKTLPLVERDGRTAVEGLRPCTPADFRPIADLPIPDGQAYLLMDIDRGNESLNEVPNAAHMQIRSEGRFPLTIEEGVSVVTQYPEFLQPNRCFMMLGSRGSDKRVPALWLSAKRPKLGWCWEGNPHTWLGFASCRTRSPAVEL